MSYQGWTDFKLYFKWLDHKFLCICVLVYSFSKYNVLCARVDQTCTSPLFFFLSLSLKVLLGNCNLKTKAIKFEFGVAKLRVL